MFHSVTLAQASYVVVNNGQVRKLSVVVNMLAVTLLVLATLVFELTSQQLQGQTRVVHLRQGALRGNVIRVSMRESLFVEQYLGIPYAAPPVGEMRFMPSGGPAPVWNGLRMMNTFGSVCPQTHPDTTKMDVSRKKYYEEVLLPYLLNEAEDCLNLNIYAPFESKFVLL